MRYCGGSQPPTPVLRTATGSPSRCDSRVSSRPARLCSYSTCSASMNESPSSRMRLLPATRPVRATRYPSWSVNTPTVRSPVLIVVWRLGQLTQPSESTAFHTSGRLRMSCCGATRRTRSSPRPKATVSAAATTTRLSVQSRNGRRWAVADAIRVAALAAGKGRSVMAQMPSAMSVPVLRLRTPPAYVGFYDKPLLKFERILETYLGVAPKGFASFRMAGPLWMKEKLFMERDIRRALGGYEGEVRYAEHHESHAASAFFPSPFEEAAILTVDGVGEWATASMGVGRGHDIALLKELYWPDSLGLLYSAFTYYTGFKVNSGEYKVMGLAPYGEPKYVETIYRNLVEVREDGSFTLNQEYFNYLTGLTMTNGAFDELFGGPARVAESKLTQREMDLARSVQVLCEEIVLSMGGTLV